MPIPKGEELYTYADYRVWDDNDRWELVDGVAYAMAPPLIRHQRISTLLCAQLSSFLEDKPCEVIAAPGVRLNAETSDNTVLIPDIAVVCDNSKIDKETIIGAPDLVIEILSPSTARFDILTKFRKYQTAQVREYWVVDPELDTVTIHCLENGKYVTTVYGHEENVSVNVLEGCMINLAKVFPDDSK